MDIQNIVAETDVLIVGSGFGGLGLAIQMKQKGKNNFLIVEREGEVGGTWRDNTYPGVECDVPSHLYSFSFRLNPEWSKTFAPGPEIQEYLKKTADEEQLRSHIHFHTEMIKSSWDANQQKWMVETSKGTYISRYLITAAGHLADEHLPKIEGLESFTGDFFHSARWNHDVSLAGKRIAIVGSGASAIQIVPRMAEIASEMVVFQRSAPYVIPRPDYVYSEGQKQLFKRMPSEMEKLRQDIFWGGEFNFIQRRNVPKFVSDAKNMALSHLKAQIQDTKLQEKLTPKYEIGCKRLLVSNTYYPTFNQDHVVLEASALAKIEGSDLISSNGERFENIEAIVFATGFEATRPPFAQRVFNAEQKSLDEQWNEGMQAYDAISVHNFPNLFIINGPNTGLGHNSVVYIIEAQVDYILQALDYLEQQSKQVFSVRKQAEDDYVKRLRTMSEGTVWLAGGCKSWYVDPRSGNLTLVWPDYAFSFRDNNGTFHPEGYEFS
ncbi:flavin-containing monooxygenase [Acinetobacter chengduensis]|uniref:NAD(P)/FAD-dependent oxidoreductase n=1 Tax=Acinetobacter chengduensis TaxID=2420890 RepID=A0ABX9TVQ7_9GAMM|nr:NAD(P)/FAD-dependent oxidoreductase [Acinetobacter chengduensis]RLL21816.1 NAD(P)/FAD-dependent oxidoreductase [Acinetobacter chengduensis]